MLMEVHCPSCGMRLRIDEKFAGRKGRCPNCKEKMMIPAIDAPGVLLVSSEAEQAPEQPQAASPEEGRPEEGRPEERPEAIYVLPPQERRHYTPPTIEIAEGLPKWMGVSIGIHAVAFLILWILGAVLVLAPVPKAKRIVTLGRFVEVETPKKMVDIPVKEESRPKLEYILTSTNPVENSNVKPVVGEVTGLPNVGPATPGDTGPPVIGFEVGAGGGFSSLGTGGRGFTPGSTGVGKATPSFFGNKAKQGAESIVFIIDASCTMGQIGKRFEMAIAELHSSIEKMTAGHRFNIIFFSDQCLKWQDHLVVATPENKQAALEFLESMREFKGGGTLFVPPLKEAISEGPEVIFLLTDGDHPAEDDNEIMDLNKEKKVRFYPIGYGDKVAEIFLQKLANTSGGRYTLGKM